MRFSHYQYLSNNMFQTDDAGNIKLHHAAIEAESLPPLVLAYIGDAYFTLFVRTQLLHFENHKVQLLNDFSAKIVSAVYQAYAYEQLKDNLTYKEKDIYRRAHNAKSHAPRVATVAQYHSSTGFEAIIGYLQLTDNKDRLQFICQESFELIANKLENNS